METSYTFTPTNELRSGETVQQSFTSDRATYIRDHAWMASVAMAGGMVALWAIGNPYIWTGAVGGLAAILVRGGYLASDDLKVRWDLTNMRLLGPQTRAIELNQIKDLRLFGSAVQVITKNGDKHLVKYQADRNATKLAISKAARLKADT